MHDTEKDHDYQLRRAAFGHLERLVALHGEVVPRSLLLNGFTYSGTRVSLVSAQQGIFKPRILPRIPLSILTTPPKKGRPRPYEDEIGEDGTIHYCYQGKDPLYRDNVGLRLAMQEKTPLAYFFGIVPGQYLPIWPVFIVGDDPRSQKFRVQVDDINILREPAQRDIPLTEGRERRRYITVTAQRRMHQQGFRARVLKAYREQCTVCRLRHAELLEAAHIIPDSDPRGTPEVSNGLALCKLHHAAFDRNVLGIRPDRRIHIRQDILEEEDGPMLRHGLQGFQDKLIRIPRSTELQPNPDSLAERYKLFRSA